MWGGNCEAQHLGASQMQVTFQNVQELKQKVSWGEGEGAPLKPE